MTFKSASFVLFLCFAILGTTTADTGDGTVYLQPWLVGIIAVAVFLVLAFVFLLFNHYVCEKFYDYDEDPIDEEEGKSTYIKGLNITQPEDDEGTELRHTYVNTSFKPDDTEITQL